MSSQELEANTPYTALTNVQTKPLVSLNGLNPRQTETLRAFLRGYIIRSTNNSAPDVLKLKYNIISTSLQLETLEKELVEELKNGVSFSSHSASSTACSNSSLSATSLSSRGVSTHVSSSMGSTARNSFATAVITSLKQERRTLVCQYIQRLNSALEPKFATAAQINTDAHLRRLASQTGVRYSLEGLESNPYSALEEVTRDTSASISTKYRSRNAEDMLLALPRRFWLRPTNQETHAQLAERVRNDSERAKLVQQEKAQKLNSSSKSSLDTTKFRKMRVNSVGLNSNTNVTTATTTHTTPTLSTSSLSEAGRLGKPLTQAQAQAHTSPVRKQSVSSTGPEESKYRHARTSSSAGDSIDDVLKTLAATSEKLAGMNSMAALSRNSISIQPHQIQLQVDVNLPDETTANFIPPLTQTLCDPNLLQAALLKDDDSDYSDEESLRSDSTPSSDSGQLSRRRIPVVLDKHEEQLEELELLKLQIEQPLSRLYGQRTARLMSLTSNISSADTSSDTRHTSTQHTESRGEDKEAVQVMGEQGTVSITEEYKQVMEPFTMGTHHSKSSSTNISKPSMAKMKSLSMPPSGLLPPTAVVRRNKSLGQPLDFNSNAFSPVAVDQQNASNVPGVSNSAALKSSLTPPLDVASHKREHHFNLPENSSLGRIGNVGALFVSTDAPLRLHASNGSQSGLPSPASLLGSLSASTSTRAKVRKESISATQPQHQTLQQQLYANTALSVTSPASTTVIDRNIHSPVSEVSSTSIHVPTEDYPPQSQNQAFLNPKIHRGGIPRPATVRALPSKQSSTLALKTIPLKRLPTAAEGSPVSSTGLPSPNDLSSKFTSGESSSSDVSNLLITNNVSAVPAPTSTTPRSAVSQLSSSLSSTAAAAFARRSSAHRVSSSTASGVRELHSARVVANM